MKYAHPLIKSPCSLFPAVIFLAGKVLLKGVNRILALCAYKLCIKDFRRRNSLCGNRNACKTQTLSSYLCKQDAIKKANVDKTVFVSFLASSLFIYQTVAPSLCSELGWERYLRALSFGVKLLLMYAWIGMVIVFSLYFSGTKT